MSSERRSPHSKPHLATGAPANLPEYLREAMLLYSNGSFLSSLRILRRNNPDGEFDLLIRRFHDQMLAGALAEAGHLSEAYLMFRIREAQCLADNDLPNLAIAQFNVANVLGYGGASIESYHCMRQSAELAREQGLTQLEVSALVSAVIRMPHDVDVLERRSFLDRANALQPDAGWSDDITWCYSYLMGKLAADPQQALDHFRQAVMIAERLPASRISGISRRALADAMRANGANDAAFSQEQHALDSLEGKLGNVAHEARRQLTARVNSERSPDGPPPVTNGVPLVKMSMTDAATILATAARHITDDLPDGDIVTSKVSAYKKRSVLHQLRQAERNARHCQITILSLGRSYSFVLRKAAKWIMLDSSNLNDYRRFFDRWSTEPTCRRKILKITQQIAAEAISQKYLGNTELACESMIFALAAAVRYRHYQGLDVITYNLFRLLKDFETHVLNGLMTSSDSKEMIAPVESGNVIAKAPPPYNADLLSRLQNTLATVVRWIYPKVSRFSKRFSAGSINRSRLHLLCAQRRLLLFRETAPRFSDQRVIGQFAGGGLSGPAAPDSTSRRLLLAEIADLALELDVPETGLQNLFEEWTLVYLSEIMTRCGLPTQLSDSTKAILEKEQIDVSAGEPRLNGIEILHGVWFSLKRRETSAFATDNGDATGPLALAVDHFDFLRHLASGEGGAYGHPTAYYISQFLLPFRKHLHSRLVAGGQLPVAAESLEDLFSPALTDWMGRTHAHKRHRGVAPGFLSGVERITLQESCRLAYRFSAPVLYLLCAEEDVELWLISPDGGIVKYVLFDVDELLTAWMDIREVTAEHHVESWSDEQRHTWEQVLKELAIRIFTPYVLEMLTAYATLIIVPDGALRSVPFAALPLNGSEYVIDRFEILEAPSMTALFIADEELARRLSDAPNAIDSLVLGDIPSELFKDGLDVQNFSTPLKPLAGASREVTAVEQRIGAKALRGSHATATGLVRHFYPENKPIRARHAPVLHIASHAVERSAAEGGSAILLSGDSLSAETVRNYTNGLRASLVTLSCCHSGVGDHHPDSTLSISNAFLIAGACCVIATHWVADDTCSAELMDEFYRRIAEGERISEALRESQRTVKGQIKFRHPFYWAAFFASGSSRNPIPRRDRK